MGLRATELHAAAVIGAYEAPQVFSFSDLPFGDSGMQLGLDCEEPVLVRCAACGL